MKKALICDLVLMFLSIIIFLYYSIVPSSGLEGLEAMAWIAVSAISFGIELLALIFILILMDNKKK